MLEVLDLSSREARSGSDDAHHVLEGAASDAAIAQMALWMSRQGSLPQAVREKARSLYEHARSQSNVALNIIGTNGYARDSRLGSDLIYPERHYQKFSEGNSIQYTFMIAHDVLGLKRKIDAGEQKERAFTLAHITGPSGGSVAYGRLLGVSKTEGVARWKAGEGSMALRFLMHFLKPNEGQSSWYAFMGNEIAHSSPFLANWFEPHLTQNAARRIALFGFRNIPGGLYGNDDLGATSAWYVWSAMGIYPVIPGVGGVTVVAPMFRDVEISVPGGKSVKLRSSSGRAEDAYIQSVRRDGRETSSVWLTAEELSRGVELDFQVGGSKSTWGQDASDAPPSYGEEESDVPAGYGSIWVDEGDDSTGASSHSAFDGSRNTAWRFISETDGSKVLEVDFTSVYAASGLLLRHADVGRTSTLNSDLSSVTVSVEVKGADDSWKDAVATRGTDHDARRMLLDFAAREEEIHGLRLTFAGLDVNEEHGIYEVLAKDGSVEKAARLRSRRGVLEKSLGDDVSWIQLSTDPVLFVGGLHDRFQVTAGRTLVLGESHISVKDLDTLVSGDVDDSRIKLRVRDIDGGALQRRASSSATTWTTISPTGTVGSQYREFSLEDLRAGKIGILAGDGTKPITFTIQAVDDVTHESDSEGVTIKVVALQEVVAGNVVSSSINADGVLTPDPDTRSAWISAAGGVPLTIFVDLKDGESGLAMREGKVRSVAERLVVGSHGVAADKITISWDATEWRLSLLGSRAATSADFKAVLDVLQLETVFSATEGYRTISVHPHISGDVYRKDFYVRDVKVATSLPEPILEADFTNLRVGAKERLVLREDYMSVTDVTTALGNGDLDPARITFRVTIASGGILQEYVSSSWDAMTKVISQDYYAFTLADVRAGKIAFLAGDGLVSGNGKKIVFKVQAVDDDGNLSDSDPDDTDNRKMRRFRLSPLQPRRQGPSD